MSITLPHWNTSLYSTASWSCLHFDLLTWKHFLPSDWLAELSARGLSLTDSQPWILNMISSCRRPAGCEVTTGHKRCGKIIAWCKADVCVWSERVTFFMWLMYLKIIRSDTSHCIFWALKQSWHSFQFLQMAVQPAATAHTLWTLIGYIYKPLHNMLNCSMGKLRWPS